MYKLVAIGGKIRGKEFVLAEGVNELGRDSECLVHLEIDGISKKHLKITVNKDTAFLEDAGSSNGTFVNGKLVKKITVKNGDKIALPNVIFQMVHVIEKKVVVRKKVLKAKEEDENLLDVVPPMPESPIGKMLHVFKFRIMFIIYTFNKEYEYRSLVAVFLALFILITIALTIFPVLVDNKAVLLSEVAKRGFYYATSIARLNGSHLAKKNFDAVDAKFLDNESGVESYELFDVEGRIIRPLGKLNEYITDTFSIKAKEVAATGKEQFAEPLGDGQIGISKAIKAYNIKTGVEEVVGIIAIKFAPQSLVLEAANNSKAYLEAFTTSVLVGIIFFAIIYYLTLKNIEDIRLQIDQVLRGKQKEVIARFLFEELGPLRNSLNGVLAKYLESQGDGQQQEMTEIEDDSKYVAQLKQFLIGASGPTLVLNSEKLIMAINTQAEDLSGIRESVGAGMSLLDVARDQGFAATVIDLCDQSANNDFVCQKDNYELSGVNYEICVNSLRGKDNFAKGFYITFVEVA